MFLEREEFGKNTRYFLRENFTIKTSESNREENVSLSTAPYEKNHFTVLQLSNNFK